MIKPLATPMEIGASIRITFVTKCATFVFSNCIKGL